MHWRQNLLLLGFILIAFGAFLIAYPSLSSGESVFYIFPFFFYSSGSISIILLAAFALIFIVTVKFMMDSMNGYSAQQQDEGNQKGYMEIKAYCQYCSQPIPTNSSFCPFCGKPIDQWEGSSEEF